KKLAKHDQQQTSGPSSAEAMRKRNGFDENTSDYYFKVGDMVKMKHHDRQKLELTGRPITLSMLASRNLLDYDPAGSSTS
ncbi:hypothetical protein BASA82_000333, partial [Batrachochytrium salamandrivorans]